MDDNQTWTEKRQIVESTLLILVSWAFWFVLGYGMGVMTFAVNQ